MVILDTFSDIAEKARPHESAVNSSQIEGRAPQKTIQKRCKINGKKLAGICAQI